MSVRPLRQDALLVLAVMGGRTGLPWLPHDIRRIIFALANNCNHLCGENRKKCCWCGDRRPLAARYEAYVDGKGWLYKVSRDHYYCPTCKGRPPARKRGY